MKKYSEITLKWGTLKGWSLNVETETGKKMMTLLEEFNSEQMTMSAMLHKNSTRQTEILCELIDLSDDPNGIYHDWDGLYLTKEEAKKYIREYGKE